MPLTDKEEIVIILGIVVIATVAVIAIKKHDADTAATAITGLPSGTDSANLQTVGTTNIVAPTNYYKILGGQVDGAYNNYQAAEVPFDDGGILLSDIPVETLPSGKQVQFFIHSFPYPSRMDKSTIYSGIETPNTANGLAWRTFSDYRDGSIYASEVGSEDVYPMSLDTAKAIGMQQDITDLLFVDDSFITSNFFNTVVAGNGQYQNGNYALSPVNPTVDPSHIQNGYLIV